MNNINRKFLTVSFLLLLVTVAVLLWFLPVDLKTAPPVTFSIIDGRRINLKNLHGKPVLVTFWATTCRSCINEMPRLISLYNDPSIKGLEIIGVAMSYDPPNRVVEVTRRQNVPYLISLDIDGSIAKAFNDVQVTPTTFLIAQDGRVIRQKTGAMDMSELRQQIKSLLTQQSQAISYKPQEKNIETGT